MLRIDCERQALYTRNPEETITLISSRGIWYFERGQ